MKKQEPMTGDRLYGMDALRGIAALLVVMVHTNDETLTLSLFNRGYLAVDLFLILSGYVIARSYEGKMANGLTLPDFLRCRVGRLWPTVFIGAVIGFQPFLGDMPTSLALTYLAMVLLFVPRFSSDATTFPANPPTWSLFFELLVNVTHHLALRFMGIRSLALLAAICGAVLITFAENGNVGSTGKDFLLGIPRLLGAYCTGILIWRLRQDRPLIPGWIGIVLLPAGILLASVLPRSAGWPDFLFMYAACPIIVLSGLAPLRFLKTPLVFLGELSFPLYTVHYPILLITLRHGVEWPIAVGLTILTAWLVQAVLKAKLFRAASPLTPLPATTAPVDAQSRLPAAQ